MASLSVFNYGKGCYGPDEYQVGIVLESEHHGDALASRRRSENNRVTGTAALFSRVVAFIKNLLDLFGRQIARSGDM
jgi:hypothetical protein